LVNENHSTPNNNITPTNISAGRFNPTPTAITITVIRDKIKANRFLRKKVVPLIVPLN
jgi:hypothetical protein